MKRWFSLILSCLLVICGVFTGGCRSSSPEEGDPSENSFAEDSSQADISQDSTSGDDAPVIQILADLDCGHTNGGKVGYDAVTELLYHLKLNHGPEIEVEYVPGKGAERDNRITALHTQIMAGKGPDLYLVTCSDPSMVRLDNEGLEHPFLFPYVQSSMRQKLFLPLDDYIENAQFMEWDKQPAVLMEAGKTEKGQMVLPMTYDFRATLFRRSDISFYDSLPLSWDQAYDSNDPALWAACSYNNVEFGDSLGKLADFDTSGLTFSEEDLARVAYQTVLLLRQNTSDGFTSGFPGAPAHNSRVVTRYNRDYLSGSLVPEGAPGMLDEEDLALVPLYNIQGGVTANITSFVAIDANTEHPEEAFFIVDLLLSKELQKSCFFANLDGIPVHEDLLQPSEKLDNLKNDPNPWFFSDAGYAEYCRARSEINAVKFYSPLDVTLSEMYEDLIYSDVTGQEEVAEAAAETYRVMQMMLDES